MWFSLLASLDWDGPTSLPPHSGIEVLNLGSWLTHGDLALGVAVDFLAVVEHRLIPARVRSEWSRLKGKGLSSIWARGWLLFGLQPTRNLHMWVVLGLVLLA